MNEKNDEKNCYQILGVKYDASNEDVREAYQKICLRFQSGNQNSEEETEFFELATRAFDVLINPNLRNQYDKSVIEDPNEFLQRVEDGTIDVTPNPNGNGSDDVSLVNGISEPSRRVRKGTLTGMGGKGRLSHSAIPRSTYTDVTDGTPTPAPPTRTRTPSLGQGSRARRVTLDLPRGAASEVFSEEDQKVPMDYLLLFLAIGVPLLTLIWAFWVVMSGE